MHFYLSKPKYKNIRACVDGIGRLVSSLQHEKNVNRQYYEIFQFDFDSHTISNIFYSILFITLYTNYCCMLMSLNMNTGKFSIHDVSFCS